ncbi:MAG: hypothetical protein SNJ64_04545 [Endomicrobiia bacterium]
MKEKIILTLLSITLLISYSIAEKCCPGHRHEMKQKNFTQKTGKDYKHKIERRIQNAIESGLITKDQGNELLTQKKELEDYKTTIWQDDVMTKEEKDKLDTMRKDFKEKMHTVLETAMKKWDEKQSPTQHFYFVVENALKNGKITKNQADGLRKKIAELENLEQQIWSDDKMTKEEFEKLKQSKNSLKKDMKEFLPKPEDKMKKSGHIKKSNDCQNPECSHPIEKKQ